MKNKNGFAFVETIITVVILSTSLLLLYSTYSAILNDEKTRTYYDDPAFIYYTNYVKKYLEEYVNLDNIKSNDFNNTYIRTIGTNNVLSNNNSDPSLETIVGNFKINQIILIKTEMFNNCFNGSESYCEESLSKIYTYNMKKYVNSLNDTSSEYILAIEYSFKLSDEDSTSGEKKFVKCTPLFDKKCKAYYASVALN